MALSRLSSLALACLFALSSMAGAQEVAKLASFVDWSLYTDGNKPHEFCFLTSAPKSSDPADTPRETPRIYISAWPKDGVKTEPSIRLGFCHSAIDYKCFLFIRHIGLQLQFLN